MCCFVTVLHQLHQTNPDMTPFPHYEKADLNNKNVIKFKVTQQLTQKKMFLIHEASQIQARIMFIFCLWPFFISGRTYRHYQNILASNVFTWCSCIDNIWKVDHVGLAASFGPILVCQWSADDLCDLSVASNISICLCPDVRLGPSMNACDLPKRKSSFCPSHRYQPFSFTSSTPKM